MVPFIQSPSSGSTAPDEAAGFNSELPKPGSQHFDAAMNRAMQRDSSARENSSPRNQQTSRPTVNPSRADRPGQSHTDPQTTASEAATEGTPSQDADADSSDDASHGHLKHPPIRKSKNSPDQVEPPGSVIPDHATLPALALTTALVIPATTPTIDPSSTTMTTGGSSNTTTTPISDLLVDPKNPKTSDPDPNGQQTKTHVSADAIRPNAGAAQKNAEAKDPPPSKEQRTVLPDGDATANAQKISATLDMAAQGSNKTPALKVPEQLGLPPPGLSPPNGAAASHPSGDQATSPTSNDSDGPISISSLSGKAGPPAVGISAAKQELPMKKAEKMQKSADLSLQNVPGDSALSAGKTQLPTAQPTLASAEVLNASSSENRLISLERTHDLVATYALRVNHSNNETMRVVIEPGSGTRLSLELRFNNGTVEAQATLHRGDLAFLTQHWSELQQRLEPRGVHLGALESSTQFSTDQNQSKNAERQPGEEPPARSAFAEFALDGPMASKPRGARNRSKNHQGWETWA